MKKNAQILLIFAVMVSLSACGSTSKPAVNDQPAQTGNEANNAAADQAGNADDLLNEQANTDAAGNTEAQPEETTLPGNNVSDTASTTTGAENIKTPSGTGIDPLPTDTVDTNTGVTDTPAGAVAN